MRQVRCALYRLGYSAQTFDAVCAALLALSHSAIKRRLGADIDDLPCSASWSHAPDPEQPTYRGHRPPRDPGRQVETARRKRKRTDPQVIDEVL